MPPGNALSVSTDSIPASRAPARRAVRVQPSNATWPRVALRMASRWASRSIVSPLRQGGGFLAADSGCPLGRAVAQLLSEGQQRQVSHPLRIEDAIEMVAFMLDDASVESARLALDPLPLDAEPAVADAGPARHRTRQ